MTLEQTIKPEIEFIDKPLQEGENSHYHCKICGAYISGENRYSHRCSEIAVESKRRGEQLKAKRRYCIK